MKRAIAALVGALSLMVITAGTALATTVQVDFTAQPTTDITLPNSVTLSGVTFAYDSTATGDGINPIVPNFATVNSGGVQGSTLGNFEMIFTAPATALNLNFTLSPAVTNELFP